VQCFVDVTVTLPAGACHEVASLTTGDVGPCCPGFTDLEVSAVSGTATRYSFETTEGAEVRCVHSCIGLGCESTPFDTAFYTSLSPPATLRDADAFWDVVDNEVWVNSFLPVCVNAH
jgi:hypothetical protein